MERFSQFECENVVRWKVTHGIWVRIPPLPRFIFPPRTIERRRKIFPPDENWKKGMQVMPSEWMVIRKKELYTLQLFVVAISISWELNVHIGEQ